MKTRLSIYVAALACLTIAGAGNAQAFTHIGPLNNMQHGHRTAPSNFQSIQIFKPTVTASPIKIDAPKYQAKPRQQSIDPATQRPRP